MLLDEYQIKSLSTATYKDKDTALMLSTLGLNGEAGEVAEKIKKYFRDQNQTLDKEYIHDITKELGDVLWYVSVLSHTLGVSLSEVAQINLDKLQNRKNKNMIETAQRGQYD